VTPARVRPTTTLRVLAFWVTTAALTAGTLQVGIAAVRHFVLHEFIWVSRDFVWMIPLGYLAIFGAIALPVAALAIVAPRLMPERFMAFIFSALAALSVMLMFSRLHPLASVAVAIGFGVRTAALIPSGTTQGRPWIPQWVVGTALVLMAASAMREGMYRYRESRTIGALPPSPAGAPNVLLIILDTVRAASMSFMGYERATTPEIARVAGEGIVFDQAYAMAPWTLPSHAGIFTARYPSTLSADWRVPLDATQPLLSEAFARAGYVTAGFAANHFYTSWESGLTRGFAHYEDYRRTWKQVLLSTTLLQTNFFWSVAHDLRLSNIATQLLHLDLRTQTMWTSDRKLAGLVSTEFLDWEGKPRTRPYFAFLNFYDAHLPYDPPGEWHTRFAGEPNDLDRYDGAIAYMDHEVGRTLDALRTRGVLDNTVVIITSDHGEGFGEHGLHGHGNSLYRPELHVPLVIRYPARVPQAQRVDTPASLRDLGATLFDLTGMQAFNTLAGASLASAWQATTAPSNLSPVVSEVSAGINTEPSAPVSRGAMRSLIDSTAHYIRNGDGVEELYSYRSDPAEGRDLAADDSARVATLRAVARQAVISESVKR